MMAHRQSCSALRWPHCAVPPLLLAALLSGCAVGPDYRAPADTHDGPWHSELTLATTLATNQEEADPANWWKRLNDPILNQLIDEAVHNNRDVAAAIANVEQAKALRAVAAGGYFPSLDANASGSHNRYSKQTGIGANTGTRNTYSASLDASWELDLFGKTRRSVEAANASLGASEAVKDGLELSVIGDVASNYFEVRGLQRQLANTKRDIELLREVEEIARTQFEIGVATELDLARATGERQALQATLPNLEAEITARIYRISVLTGKAPGFHARMLTESKPLPMPPDQVPVGLRSEMLKRRPDVREAERNLAAATANIGVAKANLYPSFSLTGSIGSSARVFSDLFTPATQTSAIGAALGWPIFAGGSLLANVDVAKAGQKAALANYQQAVLLALQDAEESLMRYGKEWQTLKQLRETAASRRQAFEIARLRYEAGEENFLVILDAERTLVAARNDIVSSETRVLTDLAQLYKALGGGWKAVDASGGKPEKTSGKP